MGKTTTKATGVGDRVPKQLQARLKPVRSKKAGGKSYHDDRNEGRKSKQELKGITVKREHLRLASLKTDTKSSVKVKDNNGLLHKGATASKKKKKARVLSSPPKEKTFSKTEDPFSECIWEVDPFSTSDSGSNKAATKYQRSNPTSEAVLKSGGASVRDSSCITIVDLGPGFRFGTHQAVSLPLTGGHVAKSKKQKVSVKSNTKKAFLGTPAGVSNLKDASDIDKNFESGMLDGKSRSQRKPIESVFVVDLSNSASTTKELRRGTEDISALKQIQNGCPRVKTSDEGVSEVVTLTKKSGKSKKRKLSAVKRAKGDDCGSIDSPGSEDTVKKEANRSTEGETKSDQKNKKLQKSPHGFPNESKEDCSKPEQPSPQRNKDEINIEDSESSTPRDEGRKRKTKRRKKSHKAKSAVNEKSDETLQEGTTKEENLGKESNLEEKALNPKVCERVNIEVDEGCSKEAVGTSQDDDETPSEPDLDLTVEDNGAFSDNAVSSETPFDSEEGGMADMAGENLTNVIQNPERKDATPSDQRDKRYPSYRIVKLRNSAQCLVLLSHPSRLAFHGRVLIRAIHGSVTVLGFPVTANRQYYPLYSPNSSCALCLETASGGRTHQLGDPTTLVQDLDAFLREEGEPAIDEAIEGGEGPGRFDVALIIKKMPEDTAVDYVERFPGFSNIFNSPENKEGLQQDEDQASSSAAAGAVGFQPITPGAPCTAFSPLPGYQSVVQAVQRWLSHAAGVSPVILICGWKNVGKSTLYRYLSNSLIARSDSVCYLECDMGQTEFTPPGMLSLQRITEPVLGPPFTHSRKAEKMCFYGDVHVRADPDSYLKIVKYLIQEYQTNHRHQPLIINTMGWMQGLGLQLLVDIIRMTRPTHIVQLWSPAQPRVIPRLTQEFLEQTPGWLHQSEEGKDTMMAQFPEVLQVDVPNIVDKGCAKYKASDHRTMALLAGLSKLQPSPLPQAPVPLSALTPLVLPWRCVAVHVSSGHVPLKQIMYALNGSVVGLCQADPAEMLFVSKDHPKVFKSTPVCQCHGLGIIRGIDPVQKVFYILAAVSQDALQEVNALFKGALTLPQPLLTQGHRVADVPYVSREYSSVIIGSGAIKVRRNIKQRGR